MGFSVKMPSIKMPNTSDLGNIDLKSKMSSVAGGFKSVVSDLQGQASGIDVMSEIKKAGMEMPDLESMANVETPGIEGINISTPSMPDIPDVPDISSLI